MKQPKSIFCQAFTDYKGQKIYHIDEIELATFKGRELFNFADLYAGRVEDQYMARNRKKAFRKGILIGLFVGAVVALLSGFDLSKEIDLFISNLNQMLWQR